MNKMSSFFSYRILSQQALMQPKRHPMHNHFHK